MHRKWHKYDLAVAELEKATSLTPENPGTASQPRRRLISTSARMTKPSPPSITRFELSATPLVWNNIAYQLSLKKSHLDRAQQYAESAVSATNAALRNLSIDRLTQQELGLVPSLIAYWDTLGWVYFSEGNLDKAEKYVSAAWGLGQHGEVGDHLAQIYEKEGKKDRALQTYELSLSGLRPIPETQTRIDALIKSDAKLNPSAARDRFSFCNRSAASIWAKPKKPATRISSSCSAAPPALPQKPKP